MLRKMSLQLRLTIFTALLLTICCAFLYILISNTALLRMDDIGTTVLSLELEDVGEGTINLDVPSMAPMIKTALDETKEQFHRQCLIATILVILIGSSLTWFLTGVALRPLRDLNRKISEISENNLSQTIPETGGQDEIGVLTHSFNRMLHRLDAAFLSQKQFTANAAHELRTPLAILQTSLEVFNKKNSHSETDYANVIQSTLRQTGHMNHLISSLLELMSLHTASLTDEVELTSLTDEILCDLTPLAEQKSISMTQSGIPCMLHGNEVLLYRAIYNLIENAIKYNKDNGTIHVDIKEKEKEGIIITVSDSGSGIPEEHWNSIFKPFYRVDKSRSRSMGGAGLGLALVSDIAELHNGKAYIKSSSSMGSEICIHIIRNK